MKVKEMRNAAGTLLLLLILLSITGVQVHAQPLESQVSERLFNHLVRLMELQDDLMELGEVASETLVQEGALALVGTSGTAFGLVDTTRTMVEIYENISCSRDRAAVKPIIDKAIQMNLGEIDQVFVKNVNRVIANVDHSAITASGIHLRDELRAISATLKSIGIEP